MANEETTRQDTFDADGEVRTAISDGLVALLKEYYGRGPERAKTYKGVEDRAGAHA